LTRSWQVRRLPRSAASRCQPLAAPATLP
jgi:hypothetical protein